MAKKKKVTRRYKNTYPNSDTMLKTADTLGGLVMVGVAANMLKK